MANEVLPWTRSERVSWTRLVRKEQGPQGLAQSPLLAMASLGIYKAILPTLQYDRVEVGAGVDILEHHSLMRLLCLRLG